MSEASLTNALSQLPQETIEIARDLGRASYLELYSAFRDAKDEHAKFQATLKGENGTIYEFDIHSIEELIVQKTAIEECLAMNWLGVFAQLRSLGYRVERMQS